MADRALAAGARSDEFDPGPVGGYVLLEPKSGFARCVVAFRLPISGCEVKHAKVARDFELMGQARAVIEAARLLAFHAQLLR